VQETVVEVDDHSRVSGVSVGIEVRAGDRGAHVHVHDLHAMAVALGLRSGEPNRPHFGVGEECLGHGEAVENADFARQIVESDPEGAFHLPVKALTWEQPTAAGVRVWPRTTDPGDLDPSDAGSSQFVGDIAMILGAMIDVGRRP
jgi:hypothetical protein